MVDRGRLLALARHELLPLALARLDRAPLGRVQLALAPLDFQPSTQQRTMRRLLAK